VNAKRILAELLEEARVVFFTDATFLINYAIEACREAVRGDL
jgi:hypothetical protein